MRQLRLWAPWAASALALAIASHAAIADTKRTRKRAKPRESVATCTSFDQLDRDDEAIDLVIANDCEVTLACSLSWTVTCKPRGAASHRHNHGVTFSLEASQSQTNLASADACGNAGWEIDDVVWSCQPGS